MLEQVLQSYVELVLGLRNYGSYMQDAASLKLYWLLVDLKTQGYDVTRFVDQLKTYDKDQTVERSMTYYFWLGIDAEEFHDCDV